MFSFLRKTDFSQRLNSGLISVGCAARVGYHAAHIGTLIWYFLNGAFGIFD